MTETSSTHTATRIDLLRIGQRPILADENRLLVEVQGVQRFVGGGVPINRLSGHRLQAGGVGRLSLPVGRAGDLLCNDPDREISCTKSCTLV